MPASRQPLESLRSHSFPMVWNGGWSLGAFRNVETSAFRRYDMGGTEANSSRQGTFIDASHLPLQSPNLLLLLSLRNTESTFPLSARE